MSDVLSIVSGWINYLFPNKEAEEMARARAEVCDKCEFAAPGWYEVIREGRIEKIRGLVCKGCPTKIKCPLSTKLRSPEETCPLEKW